MFSYNFLASFIKIKIQRSAQIVHFKPFWAIQGQNWLKSRHPRVIPGYRITKPNSKYLVITFWQVLSKSKAPIFSDQHKQFIFNHFGPFWAKNRLKSRHPRVIPGYNIIKSYSKYIVTTFQQILSKSKVSIFCNQHKYLIFCHFGPGPKSVKISAPKSYPRVQNIEIIQ